MISSKSETQKLDNSLKLFFSHFSLQGRWPNLHPQSKDEDIGGLNHGTFSVKASLEQTIHFLAFFKLHNNHIQSWMSILGMIVSKEKSRRFIYCGKVFLGTLYSGERRRLLQHLHESPQGSRWPESWPRHFHHWLRNLPSSRRLPGNFPFC